MGTGLLTRTDVAGPKVSQPRYHLARRWSLVASMNDDENARHAAEVAAIAGAFDEGGQPLPESIQRELELASHTSASVMTTLRAAVTVLGFVLWDAGWVGLGLDNADWFARGPLLGVLNVLADSIIGVCAMGTVAYLTGFYKDPHVGRLLFALYAILAALAWTHFGVTDALTANRKSLRYAINTIGLAGVLWSLWRDKVQSTPEIWAPLLTPFTFIGLAYVLREAWPFIAATMRDVDDSGPDL
jgi:hypothetical protein